MQHLTVCHVLFYSVVKYITGQYFRIPNFVSKFAHSVNSQAQANRLYVEGEEGDHRCCEEGAESVQTGQGDEQEMGHQS